MFLLLRPTSVVPVIESGQNEQMPPIVRVSNIIHLAGKPTLWYFRGINDESDSAPAIHTNYARHH